MLDRGGHIVNICSLSAKKGESFNATYSATKGGLALFTDALRQEVHGTSVGVSAIFPGLVKDVGMYSDSQVKAPLILGTISSNKVAGAVIKAIKKNKPDVIVNSGPLRPLLAIDALFPNFGNWKVRMQLMFKGKMPVTEGLPYTWYETPNIHFFTLKDFQELCKNSNINIERSIALTSNGRQFEIKNYSVSANLITDEAIFLLSKRTFNPIKIKINQKILSRSTIIAN